MLGPIIDPAASPPRTCHRLLRFLIKTTSSGEIRWGSRSFSITRTLDGWGGTSTAIPTRCSPPHRVMRSPTKGPAVLFEKLNFPFLPCAPQSAGSSKSHPLPTIATGISARMHPIPSKVSATNFNGKPLPPPPSLLPSNFGAVISFGKVRQQTARASKLLIRSPDCCRASHLQIRRPIWRATVSSCPDDAQYDPRSRAADGQ